MARKNFRGYLQGDSVRLKKYFYVLRPLLAVQWIEAGKGVPPMRFEELLAGTVTDPLLLAEIEQLLARKQRAGEAEYGERLERIHAFIRQQLDENRVSEELPDSERRDCRDLDALLMKTVLSV
jgi:predicted nucleotidyltransferase